MRFYYILWSDAINWTRSSIQNIGIWKTHTLTFITLAMFCNVLIGGVIVEKLLSVKLLLFMDFRILNSDELDTFISNIIFLFLPLLSFNYLLVFRNKRWESIRKKYPHKNGKIYKAYVLMSVVFPIGIVCIAGIIWKLFN